MKHELRIRITKMQRPVKPELERPELIDVPDDMTPEEFARTIMKTPLPDDWDEFNADLDGKWDEHERQS